MACMVSFSIFLEYLARAVDYAQKTKWTIEGLGKKVIAPENNNVDMDDCFEKTDVESHGPYAANGVEVNSAKWHLNDTQVIPN